MTLKVDVKTGEVKWGQWRGGGVDNWRCFEDGVLQKSLGLFSKYLEQWFGTNTSF
jgi:hypothetical protein